MEYRPTYLNELHTFRKNKYLSFFPMPNDNSYLNELHNNRASLHKALVAAVSETTDVHADSTNPFHKNKYASLGAHLSAIKPIFAKHGLAVIQFPSSNENSIGVTTIIIHEGGSQMMDTITIPVSAGIKGQDAGAIISYLRRYSLASVAGIATEDDDAEIDRITKSVSPSATTTKFVPNTSAKTSVIAGETDFNLAVPFGKAKGTALKDLPINDLDYWANKWEPKPWEKTGKIGQKDLSLKQSAQALWSIKSAESEQDSGSEDDDQVPF